MTECIQESFGFEAPGGRESVARFDGGTMTSDGGVLLLERTERRLDMVSRLAACFDDSRNPLLVRHQLPELLRQRIFGLALAYADLTGHDVLRHDPLLCAVSGKRRVEQEALQEGRFFHGYYDEYVYLPLYIFAGEHLLCARLRTADQDAAAGSPEEVARIAAAIRRHWPTVEILLRADSGFCREELMRWCEEHGVRYVFGLARNPRLRRKIAPRVSAETLRANQLRVCLAGLRRLGLAGTELARAQAETIRVRLLKIGARIRITVRKIWVSLASSYPLQGLFGQVWAQLRC